MEPPPASTAPWLPACIIPGPPPVTIEKPFLTNNEPSLRASSYHLLPSSNLADPKIVTVILKSAKNCQPKISSDRILRTRQWMEALKSPWGSFSAWGNFEAGKLNFQCFVSISELYTINSTI